jgi:hypothetical protein
MDWENNAEDMRKPFMDDKKKGLQNGVPFSIHGFILEVVSKPSPAKDQRTGPPKIGGIFDNRAQNQGGVQI